MRFGLCIFILVSFLACAQDMLLYLRNSDIIALAKQHYGEQGHRRIQQWLAFIDESKTESELQNIHLVNDFFNENIKYKTDDELWLQKDYWATPLESLGVGMGDCEDYVIAKYFTLIALGIPEDKIRFMYVRQRTVNQPHMVLIYFEKPNQIPYVLGNFNTKLLPANKRNDLTPIYSFNGQGLWLAKSKGLGNKVKNSRGVSAWNTMLERIEQGQLSPVKNNYKGTTSYVSAY
ncbi:transglutaminase-like cysteine peptidase [Pseudoalteromonas sp. SG41-6]|uniref:transglutaminase-like cysteine peptidase n=1 Tax=Pseudoalteromonas sp. SG41-6 TaxID=2760974 RepID=UPI0015FF471A|nr:transglutaminase-like cysteine peptidase [Pseudoalteromonas sp. SG41-6]MBB1449113.1 transglutaminase-like cysteine peptidase [Pseudoalteromonas sp. SG41-6]